jgi:hypothetical protein
MPEDYEIVPSADSYYVASWGDDGNQGKDPSLPLKTLGFAVDMAAGDEKRRSVIILSDLDELSEEPSGSEAIFVIDGTEAKGVEIVLDGRGNISLSGSGDSRPILLVKGGARLVLKNMSLRRSLEQGLVVEGQGTVITGRNLSLVSNGEGALVRGGASLTLAETSVVTQNFPLGGVWVKDSGSSFTLTENTVVSYNTGPHGGIFVEGAACVMDGGVLVTENKNPASGGGVSVKNGGVFRMGGNSSLYRNTALAGDGGGLYLEDSAALIEGNASVNNNNAHGNGGGAALDNSSLTLADNARVTINGADNGGGIALTNASSLDMGGGTRISENRLASHGAVAGGGVHAEAGSTVRMSGIARIVMNAGTGVFMNGGCSLSMDENSKIFSHTTMQPPYASGVTMLDSSGLEMKMAAAIFANKGGVYITGAAGGTPFTMSGNSSVYENNQAPLSSGGGIHIGNNIVFTMSDSSSIRSNKAETGNGGGVCLSGSAQFILAGGRISGNIALAGGGVCLDEATLVPDFTMTGGRISSNTALKKAGYTPSGQGGGVAVLANGTFSKTASGGIIYGYNSDPALANTADDDPADANRSHAVYAASIKHPDEFGEYDIH